MKNSKRRMEIIEVTPKLAEEWLRKNTKNRPMRAGMVESYANSMTMDKWTLTPEAIIFSAPFVDSVSLEKKPETLIDGQHRLAAIIKSGKTVPMTVWFGCEPEEFNAIGQGRRRTNGDILHLTQTGLKDPFVIASACSAFAHHVLAYKDAVEPWIVGEILSEFPADMTMASKYKSKLRRLAGRQVMAALLLGRLCAATKTDSLVEQLQTGIGFGEKDAARFLYRYLHQQAMAIDNYDSPETVFYKACNAIAHHLDGRKCEMLMATPTGINYLRNTARKRLEPILTAIYGPPENWPTNFWEPIVSNARRRTARAQKKREAVHA